MDLKGALTSSRKILLVDDEQAVLDGIARRLGTDYLLTLSSSPHAALDMLADGHDFAVILTDMQMPGMDGLSFIRKARELAPRSVFLMLTGNQDLPTATRALNEGQVFRYFTKPCSSQDLRAGLDSALRQVDLLLAERELLQRTFVGSVNILCDIMGFAQPLLTIVNERMQRLVKTACESLSWETHWEYLVAAKLALIGFVLTKPEAFAKFLTNPQMTPDNKEFYLGALDTSARLLEKIPRLESIAALVTQMHATDGSLIARKSFDGNCDIENGGTMLGLSLAHVFGTRKYGGEMASNRAVEQLYVAPDAKLIQIFHRHDKLNYDSRRPTRKVNVDQLFAGMVLAEDIKLPGADMTLRAGDVLTEVAVAHLPTVSNSLITMSVQMPGV